MPFAFCFCPRSDEDTPSSSPVTDAKTTSTFHLFEGMADLLSTLMDDVLQHVLGFQPAHEAVQTSVLAPHWHGLWKCVPRLHITRPIENWDEDNGDKMCLRNFINPLLLHRNRASLKEVKFDYNSGLEEKTNLWVRHALLCEAQLVIINDRDDDAEWMITLEGPPLVSRHLRKLELEAVHSKHKFLDFACCPVLEVLKITDCDIETESITSPSLKLLLIESSYIQNGDYWTRIFVPSLVCLQLDPGPSDGITPLLETMPFLETATVNLESPTDSCDKGDYGDCCRICAACCGDDDHKGRCVLLGGLSCAVNLELTAFCVSSLILRRDLIWCPTFSKLKTLSLNNWCLALRRDLIWCPTFSKLKTLSLNNWCLAVDLFPLVCILNHSPVLENLTLFLRELRKLPTQMEGNNTAMGKPVVSRCLKSIKIVCEGVDDKIYEIIRLLGTWDIEVNIQRKSENFRYVYY